MLKKYKDGKTFDDYFNVVFGNEILKTNPSKIIVDSGGLTKYGISDLADKIEDEKYFGIDIRTLTPEKAKEIYKKEYFTPFAEKFTDFPQLALSIFDVSVNSGVQKAKDMLRDITARHDFNGQFEVVKKFGDIKSYEAYKERRRQFYETLAKQNPVKYSSYLAGWLNRLNKTKFA